MYNIRKGKSKAIVPDSIMQKWKEAWSNPEFKAKSHQFTANHYSEIGRVEAGISRHTGGSVSHATHADRMKKNKVSGIGSQASIFYPSSSHGSSYTASHHTQSEAMEQEI
ncbi:hypothetical protein P3X46_032428 [Hevea brasiliensis]|uniref:Uncharacterized protein n=1 Tax=Hevea brasiliensis TaxID=3981 RepID=A0ABQ9KD99_HEVBR|nr:hypothetical protein P3X46_032428 [Hevea brasiliensis]